ncbi:tyrosine-type recombinase/integrase [Rapidithrix thailandica]|uniref:Tyrosine-type recombinase/integrase n=1 Tax=Rapidithrix thailandica TaxID=413964 RepID=A0AAW9S8Z0_9BACT
MPDEQLHFDYKPARLVDRNGDLKKRWYVEFYAWDAKLDKLKRKWVYIPAKYKTAKERKAYAKKLIQYTNSQLEKGAVFNAPKIRKKSNKQTQSIQEALELAFKLKTVNARAESVKSYKSVFKDFIAFLKDNEVAGKKIEDVPLKLYYDYFDELIIDREVSNSTFNNRLTILKTFFNVLISREVIEKNPLASIKRRKHKPSKNQAFSEEQKTAIEEHLLQHEPSLYFFTRFIYYGFLRPTEITRLKAGHVNLKEGHIIVYPDVSKNGKQETVAINKGFQKILEQMKIDEIPADYYIFGANNMQPGKTQLRRVRVTDKHIAVLRKLGLFDGVITLYSWKHTGVVNAYRAGIDIKTLQTQLRHHSLEMTDIYLRSLGMVINNSLSNQDW